MELEQEKVLAELFSFKAQGTRVNKVQLTYSELIAGGFKGLLPNKIFRKYGKYSIRQFGSGYQLVKVEPWMELKQEPDGSTSEPLPISGQPVINLKEMYKKNLMNKGDNVQKGKTKK